MFLCLLVGLFVWSMIPLTHCRILLKDETHFVLDSISDSDFKGSLKWYAQMQKQDESHT